MKQNIVYEAAEELLKQLKVVQKCNEGELQTEITRMEQMSKAGAAIATMADSQVKMFIATGTLPEHNLLFGGEEKVFSKQLVDGAPIGKQKFKGLLVDEFKRQ